MKKMIVIASLGLPGLLMLAGCSPSPGKADAGPAIEILGRAIVELPPNRARFSVDFEETSADSAEASARVVERANRAAEAVRMAAENEVRITSNLNVRPYYRQVTRRIGEHNEQLVENVHPDALLGYVARVSISVVVVSPEQAAAARGAALAAGPVQSSPMSFFLEPRADNQRAAFEAAVADAQARAQLVAEATGATLGKLLHLQEGNGPCLGTASQAKGFSGEAMMSRSSVAQAAPAPPGPDATAEQLAEAAGLYALAADLQPQRVEGSVCAIYTLE